VIVKNSLLAIDYNQQRKTEKVISIGGGLHHAISDYGEGFCVYNDVVIAAKYAIEKYNLKRILILDTDAHAGNGTCKAFYSDPKVLFVDAHQEGIYPGTGSVNEIGEGKGKGFTVNLPLEAGTGDKAYELIFDEIIFPLAREYKPQMIIRYGGSDPYFDDELTSLGLTLDGFEMIGKKIRELSRELCENRSVDLLCSGYNLEVLPKIWLTLVAAISGVKINFKESAPDIRDRKITETKNLIEKVKGKLAPYWKSIQVGI
jgi:acetoin utilization protein AcuC